MSLALAWRNLGRRRSRSLIAVFAVAIVVWIAILAYAMAGALTNSFYQDLTEQVGHLQVHAAGYRDAPSFRAGLIRDAGALRAEVRRLAPDARLVSTLRVPALVAGEDRSRGIAVTGQARPDRLQRAFEDDHLAAGAFLAPDDRSGILLGRSLARALELELGDDVFVYAPDAEGIGASAYTLRGLLRYDDPRQEIAAAHVSLAAAQELAAPDAIQALELHYPGVRTEGGDAVAARAAERLRAGLGPAVQVEHWSEIDPAFLAVLRFVTPVMVVMSLLFFVLAGLLVLNTIYLSTLERIREFGVVQALGASGRRVVALVTLESLLLCGTGAALGLTAGLGMVAWLADGFTVPGMEQIYAEMGMSPVLYPAVAPWQVALAVGFAVTTAVLAALGPARMAARVDPAVAMRYTV
jgi:ABC-type lipoprotein release transport system permease subunit